VIVPSNEHHHGLCLIFRSPEHRKGILCQFWSSRNPHNAGAISPGLWLHSSIGPIGVKHGIVDRAALHSITNRFLGLPEVTAVAPPRPSPSPHTHMHRRTYPAPRRTLMNWTRR
jgi:hypothetical protein